MSDMSIITTQSAQTTLNQTCFRRAHRASLEIEIDTLINVGHEFQSHQNIKQNHLHDITGLGNNVYVTLMLQLEVI